MTSGDPPEHGSRRPTLSRSLRNVILGIALAAGAVWVGWLVLGMPGMDHGGITDPAIGHIHGLAVNLADDTILIATHTGLVAVPASGGGQPERKGNSFQDVMGIATVGPNHLIGSGHPDVAGFREGLPGQLGLIESTDGGATWSLVSLTGEADLHAIAMTDTVTYAWDAASGQVMITSDRIEWESLVTMDLTALVADPADRDHVVAAGPGGYTESTDGGRTWDSIDDAPALTLLTWTSELGLAGTTGDGTVWRRVGRSAWERVGSLPAAPVAITADGASVYAATHSETGGMAIHRSDDAGTTWTTIYSNPDD